jgi:outer membrane biogenesis lipoprotein LolB
MAIVKSLLSAVVSRAPYKLLFALFLLTNCQTSIEKTPPHFSKSKISSDYIFNQLETRANKIHSVKSFTRTTFIGKEFKQSFRQALLIKENRSIRVDTYGLFGQVMGIFISDAGKMQFMDPAKGKLYSGSDVKNMLRKLIGTQINLQEHLRIFLGQVPNFEFLKVEKSRLSTDRKEYIFQAQDLKQNGKVHLHIDALTLLPLEMTRIEMGQKKYYAHWQDYEKIGDIDWPHLITLEFPSREETIRIKYKDPTLNEKISQNTFQFMQPASVKQ